MYLNVWVHRAPAAVYEILQSESDDFALAAQLLSLLHGAAERNLRCRRLIEFLS